MALHIEPLTGGLVTARDPSLLEEGELVSASSALYRPFNQALSPIGARATFGSSVGVNITGLRSVQFESDTTTITRLIIAHGTIWQAGTGGAWTTVRSGVTTAQRIEAIGFENTYYLSNGVDDPVAFGGGAITVRHGMLPTEHDDYSVTTTTGGGDWSLLGTGWYYYWFTEYDSTLNIESAFTSVVGGEVGEIASNTDENHVVIAYGQAGYAALHNANANTWRIYRSPVVEPGTISPFPSGFLVGEVAIPGAPAITTFDDDGIQSDTPYNFLSISVAGGPATLIQRDSIPPDWATGDVFEDSLVVNDTAEPNLVRYSFPGLPHSFPELYFIGFNTKQVDRVTCIKSLDAVCVVGLQSQVWRLNYLPNETDSEFNRGRCRELISANHGISGPDAACIFTPVEGNSQIAYVSHDGIYATDGLSTRLLTMDIDWNALVSKADLPTCILVNVQHLWSLFLYYVPSGGSAPNSKILHLSYHPQHLKNGSYLKVSGPTTLTARAADYAANTARAFATTTDVHEEDVTQTANTLSATTRYIYPEGAGLSTETYAERVRILTGLYNGAGTFNVAWKRRKSNQADQTDTSKAYVPSTTENRLISLELHARAEALGLVINSQADTHYVAFEYEVTQGT